MIGTVAIAFYFQADLMDSLPFKLVAVGIPLAVPFVIAFLALWKSKRGQDSWKAAFAVRTIVALVTFKVGILGSLMWFAVNDEIIDRANTVRYKETSSRIKVGMTKVELIELAGAPNNVSRGKDGEEFWMWQSHHRREHPLAYKVIGRPSYQGGPFLMISFDSSEQVATIDTHSTWR